MWLDDCTQYDVIIKATEDLDENDDAIFYYGIPEAEVRRLYENAEPYENEFLIIAIEGTYDSLI